MKTLRCFAVFPLECVLLVCVLVYVVAEWICNGVGQLIRLIEGKP